MQRGKREVVDTNAAQSKQRTNIPPRCPQSIAAWKTWFQTNHGNLRTLLKDPEYGIAEK